MRERRRKKKGAEKVGGVKGKARKERERE